MFQKTVKKFCNEPGCRLKGIPVDLSLNVCEEDGSPLLEEKALDKRAAAIAGAVVVVLVGAISFAATLYARSWLVAKATSAVVAQVSDIYNPAVAAQITARAKELVARYGRDEQAQKRIAQQLRDEALAKLNAPEVQAALETAYRDGVKSPEEDARLNALRADLTKKYGITDAVFNARENAVKDEFARLQGQVQEAVALAGKGDFGQAAERFEQVVRRDPANVWAQANLCAAYLQLQRIDNARAACERAVQAGPDNWLAHYNLASVKLADGDSGTALAELQSAVTLVERHAPRRMTRAALVEQMKRDTALAGLRKDPAFAKLTSAR